MESDASLYLAQFVILYLFFFFLIFTLSITPLDYKHCEGRN